MLRDTPSQPLASAAARNSFPPSPGVHEESQDKRPPKCQSIASTASRWRDPDNKADRDRSDGPPTQPGDLRSPPAVGQSGSPQLLVRFYPPLVEDAELPRLRNLALTAHIPATGAPAPNLDSLQAHALAAQLRTPNRASPCTSVQG